MGSVKRCVIATFLGAILVGTYSWPVRGVAASRPDVLMIIVDDLNDWISLLDSQAPIPTPNLERLAGRGMHFSRAYCVSAACNPSRVATLTGLRPSSSGVYGNRSDWRRALPNRPTLMQRFRSAGYLVRGAGKVFHHHMAGAFHDPASFEDFQPMRAQWYPDAKLNQAPEYGSRNTDWGAWPPQEDATIDAHTLAYCQEALRSPPPDRPQFLVCGLFKPHSPFFAPAVYHEAFANLTLPLRREDDWADLPRGALELMRGKQWFWRGMMGVDDRRPGSYLEFVKAYAACASFADTLVGRLLDTLETTQRGRETIVVLWSDHGFHLGEKEHIEKFALWEKSNRIPFVVVAPGTTKSGSRCDVPVDLSVLYPTLLELAGLDADPECDGRSIVSLLAGEAADVETPPALMTYQRGNHAVRSARWRYIRYRDGTEELYDHRADPHEWDNQAKDPRWESVKAAHRRWLPQNEAAPVPDKRKP